MYLKNYARPMPRIYKRVTPALSNAMLALGMGVTMGLFLAKFI